jgi:CRP-like cAMP-binding protein
MGPAEIDAVLARAVIRTVEAGETVIHRGDPSAGLIMILQGRLRIGVVSAEGREVTLRVLGAGQVLGEISLLDGKPASADVQAVEDCSLLQVARSHILDLLRRDAELCLRMMAVLCQRLRQANDTVEDLALHDLPRRIGRVLLRLAREFPKPDKQGIGIGVKLSQREIALLVGASREKVNRELCLLEASGTIRKQAGHLVILRPDSLDV